MTKYILAVLSVLILLFGGLSYHFYGELQVAQENIKELSSSLKNCQSNEEKAKANTKNISDGMSSVLIENERINKDFQTLKEQLKNKRVCNANQLVPNTSDSVGSNYASDITRLLSEGANKARNGSSNNTQSSN